MKKSIVLWLVLLLQVVVLTALLIWFRNLGSTERTQERVPDPVVEEWMKPAPVESPEAEPVVGGGGCHVGGCSGQVCSEEVGVMTTCEWEPEYVCYRKATCERQTDGKCGFTMTDELAACLRGAKIPEKKTGPEPL